MDAPEEEANCESLQEHNPQPIVIILPYNNEIISLGI